MSLACARPTEVARREHAMCCTSTPNADGAAASDRLCGSPRELLRRGQASHGRGASRRATRRRARAARARCRRDAARARSSTSRRRGVCGASIQREKIDMVHAHTAHAVGAGRAGDVRTRVPYRRRAAGGLSAARQRRYAMEVRARRRRRSPCRSRGARRSSEADIARVRIHVVPDGVDVASATSTPAQPRDARVPRRAAGAPLVVQVAQLVGHKDPVKFVRAIARVRQIVPDVQALMVGDGSLRDDVEREIRGLELEDTVHLAGYRTDADALLRRGRRGVSQLARRREWDRCCSMRSCSASRSRRRGPAAFPSVVDDGVTGLLAGRRPVALGDAIARCSNDRALARTACAANASESRERVLGRTHVRSHDPVYEEVLNGSGGGRAIARASPASSSSSASVTRAP